MPKKAKTPRTGVPRPGFIRVVMDYPITEDGGPLLTWDIDKGHCVGSPGNAFLAPRGELVRLIRRKEDGPW